MQKVVICFNGAIKCLHDTFTSDGCLYKVDITRYCCWWVKKAMSISKLPFDVQLKVFQHIPQTEIISSSTEEAQVKVMKQFPRFDSEDSLKSFDDWNMVKECDISDALSTDSKKFIYSKLLAKKTVKSFVIMNLWRGELVSQCHCHFKRLKIVFITDLDLKSIFTHITVGELTISGNKWEFVDKETIALIKSKISKLEAGADLLTLFQ